MDSIKKRETDAIFRMMLYIKHELVRNEYKEEADKIQIIIDELEKKMDHLSHGRSV